MSSAMSSLRSALGIPLTQVPISLATFVSYIFPPLAGYVAIAALAITPRTRTTRIALCPIVILLAFRAAVSVDMSNGKPEQKFFGGQLVRVMVAIVAHTIAWAVIKKPLVRHLRPANSSPSTIMDALELVSNCRGIGWDWSQGLHVPRETRPTGRIPFAFYTLLSVVMNVLICAVLTPAIQAFTYVGSGLDEPSIFDETLPFIIRHLRAGIVTILVTAMTYSGLRMGYDVFAILAVLFFGQDPVQWPPAYDKPWCATSLSDFWGRRWHQWFRYTFLVFAYPFNAAFGRMGGIIGVFLASGISHHLILLPFDSRSRMWRMVVGFGMMAPGVIAERAFYKITGRKVGGMAGRAWTMLWLLIWGNVITEGFVKAGVFARSSDIDGQTSGWMLVVTNLMTKFDAWLHTF